MARVTAEQLNRIEYEKRVNRVIDYINDHLAEEMSVEQLARLAAFSPFHFHRVFKSIARENLFEFIRRQRLERSATRLTHNPVLTVTDVALSSGFSSPAVFARAFKSHFGMNASEWRAGGAAQWRKRSEAESKTSQTNSKRRKAATAKRGQDGHDGRQRSASRSKEANAIVVLKSLPAYHIAYLRYVGPYGPGGISETWNRFAAWMHAHNLVSEETITLGIPQDDPGIVKAAQLRYDCGVVVPADFQRDRLVNLKDIPGGLYAVRPFWGTIPDIVVAWDDLFRNWLPESGFQPDDRPFYELHRGQSRMDNRSRLACDLCVPVSPL